MITVACFGLWHTWQKLGAKSMNLGKWFHLPYLTSQYKVCLVGKSSIFQNSYTSPQISKPFQVAFPCCCREAHQVCWKKKFPSRSPTNSSISSGAVRSWCDHKTTLEWSCDYLTSESTELHHFTSEYIRKSISTSPTAAEKYLRKERWLGRKPRSYGRWDDNGKGAGWRNRVILWLGGGFKYFLFSPLLGEDSHFD